MTINLNACIESLLNPQGRFRTLEGIFPIRDTCGQPLLYLTSTEACFVTEYRGVRSMLKVLLTQEPQALHNARKACRATEHTLSLHIEACRYLEQELLLFDHRGHGWYADAIFQQIPAGEPLDEFACRCIRERDSRALQQAVAALAEMAADFLRQDYVHGALTPRNLIVQPNGSIRAINPRLCGPSHQAGDRASLAHLALMLYRFACCPEDVLRPERWQLLRTVDLMRLRTWLEKLPRNAETVPLARLLEEASHPGVCERERFNDLLLQAATLPLQHMRDAACNQPAYTGNFHEGRAVVETPGGMGLLDPEGRFIIEPVYEDMAWDHRAGIVMLMREGCWALFDRDGNPVTGFDYDLMGECDQGLIPVRQGEKYGYIRPDGTLAIPIVYDDAFAFRNGHALVSLGGRYFTIDTAGKE